jgi:biotin carboxyl carrier protein
MPDVAQAHIAPVVRAELLITVTDDGEVVAKKLRVIRNELRWAAYIEWVAPDGSFVRGPRKDKQGKTVPAEPIIIFKCDELEEEIEHQKLKREELLNAYKQAEASLALKVSEMEAMVKKAELAGLEAKENEKRYSDPDGQAKLLLDEAEDEIQLALEELTLAEAQLAFKLDANKRLAPHSPYSENEIDADRILVKRRKLAVAKAKNRLKMLETYDIPQEKRRLEVGTRQAELALKRANLDAETQIAKARQQRASAEYIYNQAQQTLDERKADRRDKLIIKAEKDGLVVYDTGGSRYHPSDVEVKVGEKVSSRQRLMIIPEMDTLQVVAKVYEGTISELKEKLRQNKPKDLQEDKRQEMMAKFAKLKDLPPEKRAEAIKKLMAEASQRPRAAGQRDTRAEARAESQPSIMPARQPAAGPKEGRRIEAFIEFPALGSKVVTGYVDEVSAMSEDKSRWLAPGVKIYEVTVEPDEKPEGLVPTMSARVTIVLARLENVLKVPVAAVFGEQNETYCWRQTDDGFEKVPVRTGRSNEREMQILFGLNEGENVLLVAPVTEADK